MPINKDGTNITAVRYTPIGNTEKVITQVIYVDTMGTQTAVFGAQVSSPTILANPIRSYNQVTISAQNTYDVSVTIYMTVNGVTKNAVATAYQTTGDIVAFNFTGLTSNVTYSISAYSTLSGHANSAATTGSVTTTTVYTTMPSFVGTPTSTWNSISWRLRNDDDATSIVKTRLYAEDKNTPIGDELTVSLAPGGEYTFSKTGLTYSTNYYIKRTAQANDGKLQPTYAITEQSYATAGQPTTPSPSVTVVSSTTSSVTIKIVSSSSDYYSTVYYSVVSSGLGESGYITHSTELPDYYTEPDGINITLTQLYSGGLFTANTDYEVYVKNKIDGWLESSPSVHVNIKTAIQYYTVKWYDKDMVEKLSQQIAAGTVISTAAIDPGSMTGHILTWSPSLPATVNSNINFTPVYTPINYTMSWYTYYDYKTSTAAYGSYVKSAPAIDTGKPGSIFTGWDPSIAGSGFGPVSGDRRFDAVYQVIPTLSAPYGSLNYNTTSKTSTSATAYVYITNGNGTTVTVTKTGGSGSMVTHDIPANTTETATITGLSSGTSYTFTMQFSWSGYNSASGNISITTSVPQISGFIAKYNKSTQVLTTRYDPDTYHYAQLEVRVATTGTWTRITNSLSSAESTFNLSYLGYSSTTAIDAQVRTAKLDSSSGGVVSAWMRITTVNADWESGFIV